MKEYIIKKADKSIDWTLADTLCIDTYKWMDNGYAADAKAWFLYDDKNIYVKFRVVEDKVRAEHKTHGSPVCEDSCVEFFLRPVSDKRYMNFEATVIGTMLIGIGESRFDRVDTLPDDMSIFAIKPSVSDAEKFSGDAWELEYKIPFEFLEKYYGKFNLADGLYANVYKCGDETEKPHFGMWSEVDWEEPDFHRPEFFGRMYFEM